MDDRRGDPVYFSVRVPKRLQRAIKIYCVEHDRPMAAVMTEAFREYLAQRPRPRTSRRPC